ncbi:hypothetical protein C5167_002811 [Papaver somniferum]|uniref:Uncharacterized protein n=1 Tax=Papaver somniferum TaxID=3469 RepID=A0A4Y7L2M3_PAPSO|nr:hypothetical protein C5167_002811 [Papaver somniferum]
MLELELQQLPLYITRFTPLTLSAVPSDVENSQAMVNQLPTFASRLWFYPRTNLPTYRDYSLQSYLELYTRR